MNPIDVFTDTQLLGLSFAADSREPWRAIISGMFGVPMDDDRRALFKELAGGREPPTSPVKEFYGIAGRRTDKTHTMAGLAIYIGTVLAEDSGMLGRLTAGERGVIMALAVDRDQAKVLLNYVRDILRVSPILSGMVERENADGVSLTNGVDIQVATNSYRSVRGRTLLAAVLDECAFFRAEASATPDIETYRALLPSLATTGGMLLAVSSPYARRGLLYNKWKKHYGQNDDDVLVVQASTEKMNPTIDTRVIGQAYADDPIAAAAEWGAQFRSDVESFLTFDAIERCLRASPLEIPYDRMNSYFAFADAAGGGADSYCIAIGHREEKTVIVDCVRAQRGVPAEITKDYAELLKSYGLRSVVGDRYAGSWVSDEFERHGIKYETSSKNKSELYLDLLPRINSEQCEIPPDDALITQLSTLERRTRRAGRDTIDHPPGGHDDRANVVAGLLAQGRTTGTSAATWAALAHG